MKRFILTGTPGAGKTAPPASGRAGSGRRALHGRSAVCAAALADFLGYPIFACLSRELLRMEQEGIYQQRVFFIRTLGFIKPAEARRIGLEKAQRFEEMHESAYRARGFEIVSIGPGSVLDRAAAIRRAL